MVQGEWILPYVILMFIPYHCKQFHYLRRKRNVTVVTVKHCTAWRVLECSHSSVHLYCIVELDSQLRAMGTVPALNRYRVSRRMSGLGWSRHCKEQVNGMNQIMIFLVVVFVT